MSEMDQSQKKLVYYDAHGKQHEHKVPAAVYQKILGIFDGSRKAVERSNGGLGLITPTGVKLKGTHDPAREPKIFVAVNCTDFNPAAPTAEEASHIRPKMVPIEKIRQGFELAVSEDQRFMVDLGDGTIPVHVVEFFRVPNKAPMAVFLDYRQAEMIITGRARPDTSVQLYWVPEECLRWARKSPTGVDELKRARQNHERSLLQEKPLIPKLLLLGEKLRSKEGLITMDTVMDYAHEMLHNAQVGATDSRTLRMSEEGLIPFGMFEP